jgi:hypothetical protein
MEQPASRQDRAKTRPGRIDRAHLRVTGQERTASDPVHGTESELVEDEARIAVQFSWSQHQPRSSRAQRVPPPPRKLFQSQRQGGCFIVSRRVAVS